MDGGSGELNNGGDGSAPNNMFPRMLYDAPHNQDMQNPEDDPASATPRQGLYTSSIVPYSGSLSASLPPGRLLPSGSLTGSRPYTRAMARAQGHRGTTLLSLLQSVSSRPSTNVSSSRLEDARNIEYSENAGEDGEQGEEQGEEQDEDDEPQGHLLLRRKRKDRASSIRREVGQLRVTRRSARINARNVETNGVRPKQKKAKTLKLVESQRTPVRRSARLAKPLTKFEKYPELPPELKILIWEAAVNPRVVYVRNTSASAPTLRVQSKRPTWFATNRISVAVATAAYRKMFGRPAIGANNRPSQDVNPDVDIVVFEPCCSGCRGLYCSRHQFAMEDLAAVRFLAIQADSPQLAPHVPHCWETISISWPNVETLYLMQAPMQGDQPEEKAIIRIKETARLAYLRKRFDDWKKGAGKERRITTLEFAMAVDRETEPKNPALRYRSVAVRNARKTGLAEDIIIG